MKIETEPIKEVLENSTLLNWVKRNPISEVHANGELKEMTKNMGVDVQSDSIGVLSADQVSALFTNAEVNVKKHTYFSLHLAAVAKFRTRFLPQ